MKKAPLPQGSGAFFYVVELVKNTFITLRTALFFKSLYSYF